MSKTPKTPESIYVTRTVKLPLSASELEARKSELPLVISQEARLALHRKSVMAGLKDEAEELAEKRDKLVREINSEERVEDLRCLKVPVLFENSWQIIHPTTGEVMERIPMTFGEIERLTKEHADRVGDGQMTLPEEEEAPDSSDEKSDAEDEEPGEGGSFRLLALPEPSPVPPVGEDLPALEVIEGEIVDLESVPDAQAATDDEEAEPPGFMTKGGSKGEYNAFVAFWRAMHSWMAIGPAEHGKDDAFYIESQAGVEKAARYLLTGNEYAELAINAEQYRRAIKALALYNEAWEAWDPCDQWALAGNWPGVTDTSPMMVKTVRPSVSDPALSLDITPARSATDQANDFAAQLVGGGA